MMSKTVMPSLRASAVETGMNSGWGVVCRVTPASHPNEGSSMPVTPSILRETVPPTSSTTTASTMM